MYELASSRMYELASSHVLVLCLLIPTSSMPEGLEVRRRGLRRRGLRRRGPLRPLSSDQRSHLCSYH
jgi:hypothetical protein